MARAGRVVSTLGAADPEVLADRGLTGPDVVADVSRELIGRLADQVAAGRLSVDVTTVLSLEEAADGLRTIATGNARGKIVVSVAG